MDSDFYRYWKVRLVAGILLGCALTGTLSGQTNQIVILDNPSLEGEAGMSNLPQGWYYCGPAAETPPDLHPNGRFEVVQKAQDGYTYVALIGRPNGTSESVGQRLPQPLSAGQCYRIDLFASRSPRYVAIDRESGRRLNFNGALKLQLWGGSQHCGMRELLAESELITHSSWKEVQLVFRPQREIRHLIIKASHAPSGQKAYPGNVLVDHLAPIVAADCASGAYTFRPDTLRHRPLKTLVEGQELARNVGADIRFDPWSNQLLREVYAVAGQKGLRYDNLALQKLGFALRDLPGHSLELAVRGESQGLIKERIQQLQDESKRLGIVPEQLKIRRARKRDDRDDWDAQNRFLFLRLR